MAAPVLSEQDWQIRLHLYRFFVTHGRPPTYVETARHVGLPGDDVRRAYHRLHQGHALFLEPGADTIRMANPLSAIPTSYRVFVDGRALWANCAWDSLGIPAMLHTDARIEATVVPTSEAAMYTIESGRLNAVEGIVHFPLPFWRWYDDLIHT